MLSKLCYAVSGCALTRGSATHRRGSFAIIKRGEGAYELPEWLLQHVLAEAGTLRIAHEPVSVDDQGGDATLVYRTSPGDL